ncbi:hypothetical protein [Sphaerotilus microaerophilus]|nr:hypothetical protein [Sphaerotilus sp. FB-5]
MLKELLTWSWRLLRAVLRALLVLLLLFEEWGWEPLQRAVARLGRLPLLRQLEAAVARLGPHGALAVFLLPTLLLLPVKLAALWLIGQGQALLGALVIVLAKLVGTALVARLYTLTQPALMQMAWFARLHGRWMTWKASLLAQARATRAWRLARVLRRRLRRLGRELAARWGQHLRGDAGRGS